MKLMQVFLPKNTSAGQMSKSVTIHGILLAYTVIALFPILIVIMNAFKDRKGIFRDPLALPTSETFSLVGFEQVLLRSDFGLFAWNSLLVTVLAVGLVILLGAMAAWALTEYRFRMNLLITFLFAMGIMIPIRLGTVSILRLIVELNLVNTLTSLVLVYIAQGLPLAVYILSEFVRTIPKELVEAARCDAVSEYRIFFSIILPLLKPAMATVAVFTMIPIWNDLWFPLILAPSEETRTITLGVQQFVGQYVTNWTSVLAALTMAIVPVLILYTIFSRQLIRGLTSGAVK
ncbi:carbohydrate ABC transporter permease [Marinomonas aquiplantarum]|uniref:Carbohydrate ABC transporter membrane protein 2 (CUT1 family) n=1 Tax=Marinomonas aquiplantarum TaxID=491951 RepID=A0A366CYS9_9GAMM|nr:carbohydrate ABC transporter permease [Marinomonas aquiplantarum]RBO82369.1 carbohydrate ABC transporter membrane protein 2 (CUT1 family) [Marinomonas aquiplantarum]